MTIPPPIRHLLPALLLTLGTTAGVAQDAATLRLQSLASGCAACHGTHGRPVADNTVPGLAGMPAAYFVEQMQAFKRGARPSTVMQQLARGYSDAQIEQLAAYFAARPQ